MLHIAVSIVASVRVPGGHVVPESCITSVPNGAIFNASKHSPSTCDASAIRVASPNVQIYAADVHLQSKVPLTSSSSRRTALG